MHLKHILFLVLASARFTLGQSTDVAHTPTLAFIAPALALQSTAALPTCAKGMRLPRVGALNYPGTIVAVDMKKGTYQIKSESDGLLDWYPASKLSHFCKGAEASAVTESYFTGTWNLFVGPTAHHEDYGSTRYLVVGPGAKAPPLVINANGTYIWRIDSQKTVTGKWRKLADTEMRSGTKSPAILLMKGEDGKDWQVSNAGVNAGSNKDRISIDRMDLGLSYQGTRM